MNWVTIIWSMVASACLTRARRFWLAAAICSLVAIETHAAKPSYRADPTYLIDTWETEDGLPENSATAMAQTPDGYLWFGTFNGLVRFDGVKFRVFDPANTPQLPSPSVVNLHLDKVGRLWVSTDKGLVSLKDGRWTAFGADRGWTADYVRTFSEGAGKLFATSFNGKVFQFHGERFQELPQPPGEAGKGYFGHVDDEGLSWVVQHRFFGSWDGQRWNSVAPADTLFRDQNVGAGPARDGGLWVLDRSRLRKFRKGQLEKEVPLPVTHGNFWSLTEDSRGDVWIASYDAGLTRVTPSGDIRRFTTTNGLSYHSLRFVFEDREGNLWIGASGGGLMSFKRRALYTYGIEQGLPGRAVRSVAADPSGGVLTGLYGDGLARIENDRVARIRLPGAITDKADVNCVLSDRAGRVWVGTDGFGLYRLNTGDDARLTAELQGANKISALFEDSHRRVWIASEKGVFVFEDGKFHLHPPAPGLGFDAIRAFAEDRASGAIWLGSQRHQLYRYLDGAFSEVSASNDALNAPISSLLADPDGTLWIATSGAGLGRLRNGQLTMISKAHGLPANDLGCVLDDDTGNLWLGSNRGIIRVSRAGLMAVTDERRGMVACRVFDVSDGMASVECAGSGQPAGLKDTSGRLWFATLKGVSVVDPRAVRFDTNPPQVRIESVGFTSMDGAGHDFELPLESGLVLPAGARRLRIHYTGLSFASPHKMPFRYRIEGIDNDWVDAGTDRVATFHDLRPGSFRFQVTAANNDGVWNETGASLALTVQPYYWQTGWFHAGVVFLLISVSGIAASWRAQRRHREELAELERTRKQQAELAHLSRVTMLGELSGSLAHELNQPLGAILRNAEAAELFLQDPSPDLDEVRAILADIRKDDQRAGEVIDRTRAFMKRREVERRLLDLNLLAGEVATLVRQDAEIRRVRLALETDPALPPVHGDRVQLQQVFLNLLLNAMDALNDNPPTGRRVAVRTRSAGATVEVSVSDNGHGIPADKLPRVFEPFFTTKPSGVGMGLAISRTIITAHGGRITAENNRHGGATFTFTLPVTKPQGGTA